MRTVQPRVLIWGDAGWRAQSTRIYRFWGAFDSQNGLTSAFTLHIRVLPSSLLTMQLRAHAWVRRHSELAADKCFYDTFIVEHIPHG